MANSNLSDARKAKKDEFYTQFHDIQKEIAAYVEYNPKVFKNKTVLLPCDDPEWSNFTKYFAINFKEYGLKKLISTSFAAASKATIMPYEPTPFEQKSPIFNKKKTRINGKIFTLMHDKTGDGKIDVNDLDWDYLKEDGDFRSEEIKKLRNESDIIITNPPYSLWREFFDFIIKAGKKFVMVANKNCVTYKEVFPLIKKNMVWSGKTGWSGGMWFETKYDDDIDKEIDGVKMKNTPSFWLTNIDLEKRHKPIPLMSMKDNLKFNKKLKGIKEYPKYDNYDAIEVSFTDAIPSDYKGVMGVPITFLEYYVPKQFEIIGATESEGKGFSDGLWDEESGIAQPVVNKERVYKRIFIRHRK